MVDKLEETQGLGDICIDISDFIEDYHSPDYQKPIGHMPMLNGHFEKSYDP